MGKEEEQKQQETERKKPRFLCLHGFRTNGQIMKTQIEKWPPSVLEKLDLVFVDAPFPANGKSDVEGIFDPPYYEWFQFNKEFTEYTNFDECLAYIEDYMIEHGPFDGLLGFSQGAILSAALPGLQAEISSNAAAKGASYQTHTIMEAAAQRSYQTHTTNSVALTKVPKINFLVIIGGAKLKEPSLAEKAYSCPIHCPSVHFLGETDFLKPYGTELLESFVDPVVIHHPKGHTVPRLDDKGFPTMLNFIERIQKAVTGNEE